MSQYRNNHQGRTSGAGYGMGTRTSVPPRTSVPNTRPSTPRTPPTGAGSRSTTAPSGHSTPSAHSYGGSRSYGGTPTPSGPRRSSGGKAKWIVLLLVILLAAGAAAGALLAGKDQPDAPQTTQPPAAAVTQPPATAMATAVVTPTPSPTPTATPTPTPVPTPTPEPTLSPSAIQPEADVYQVYDPALRWYVQQLNVTEKELFAELYDGVAAGKETVFVTSLKYTKEQFNRALTALQKDCPELVHYDHEASVSCQMQADRIVSVTFTYLYPNQAEQQTVIQKVLDEANGLIDVSERFGSMAELEHRLYRQIVERAVYDKTFEYCANADSVFLYGKAKCSGYAAAFNLACRVHGIPCIYVTGDATNDEGTAGHAWNYVQIDGDWYVCDPTWDRSAVESFQQYPEPMSGFLNYFNVTEKQISDTHELDEEDKLESWVLPECTADKASYWNLFGGSTLVTDKDWQTVLVRQLNEAFRGQRQEIVLRIEDQKQYEKISPVFADRVDEWVKTTDNWCKYRYVLSDSSQLLMVYNIVWADDNPYRDMGLNIRFLNVGDADAAIVTCEDHIMIIDGGTEKSGSSQLYSFLENNGITHVDAIVVSHPHSDHAGGLCGALSYEQCTFGTLYSPVRSSDNKSFNTLLEKAALKDLQPVVPDIGTQFQLGGATVTFVSPQADKSYENVNNKSLVVRIDYGETSFLFTGDAMENAEEDMLRNGQDLDVDVLKVAHHGANASSTQAFLQAVTPNVAIISCGADSQDHPGTETLARLQQLGTMVLRTDLNGEIILFSDGQHLTYITEN